MTSKGVTSLTLGGGIGHLSHKYGLSCDNLPAAQVINADGRFCGLRGDGGSIGVVASFEFQLHPVSTVLGLLFVELDKRDAALHFYRDFTADFSTPALES